jgi:hypothetical protein
MAEVNLELLGRLIEALLDGQREMRAQLAEIKSGMATREQLTRLWRVAEGKLELSRDELLQRIEALEQEVQRLKESEPA